ncbi:hypothetical protein PEC18_24645 [Paucibacter sp. O1-1]|nr:hypothetical protein [Paucibacter sp. O1-1]MDA3828935.1 hypothetical protein [Paucibacter sp. O1-1]
MQHPARHRWLATLPALAALAAAAFFSAWAGAPARDEPQLITQIAEFPLRLDRPGRYRLSATIDVPAGRSGIVISAPGVELDLGGFSLRGPVLCSVEVDGTECDTAPRADLAGLQVSAADVRVHNGHVRGFAGTGLRLDARATVDDVLLSDNAGPGLHANTSASQPVRLRRVQALRNGGDGFWVQNGQLEQSGARANKGQDYSLGALARQL